MTGVSVASAKQAHASSWARAAATAREAPTPSVLRGLAAPAGAGGQGQGGAEGRGCLRASPAPARPASVASVPPPLLGARGAAAPPAAVGTAACVRRYLKCPRSHLNRPCRHHKHSRTVRALLFDKTGRQGSGPAPPRPHPLGGPRPALTPLVRLQLRLQVLGGHVEVGVLARGRPGLAAPAAAVEAAAEAAAAVAAREGPAHHEEQLRAQGCWLQRGRLRERLPPAPRGSQGWGGWGGRRGGLCPAGPGREDSDRARRPRGAGSTRTGGRAAACAGGRRRTRVSVQKRTEKWYVRSVSSPRDFRQVFPCTDKSICPQRDGKGPISV